MKTTILTLLILFIICISCNSLLQNNQQDAKFYGQKPPDKIPELYQPEFVFLKGVKYGALAFSPDRKELCFTIYDTIANQTTILYVQRKNGEWTEPDTAYFVPENGLGSLPQFSPNGNQFTYACKGDFWTSLKEDDKWLMAEKMGEPVCSDTYECGFSFAKDGSIYFASSGRSEGKGHCDIYCSKLEDNHFETSKNIESLNTGASECVVSVSPNEKYIVFTSYINKEGMNANDLFISFRKPDGEWTLAQKLGPEFNSSGSNFSPVFSSDGKYFFFCQYKKTDSENFDSKRYWVSSLIFDELKIKAKPN